LPEEEEALADGGSGVVKCPSHQGGNVLHREVEHGGLAEKDDLVVRSGHADGEQDVHAGLRHEDQARFGMYLPRCSLRCQRPEGTVGDVERQVVFVPLSMHRDSMRAPGISPAVGPA
jgi:hypothetical protein